MGGPDYKPYITDKSTSQASQPLPNCQQVHRHSRSYSTAASNVAEKSLEISCKDYLQSCREALGVCKDVFVHNKIWSTQSAVVKEEVEGKLAILRVKILDSIELQHIQMFNDTSTTLQIHRDL